MRHPHDPDVLSTLPHQEPNGHLQLISRIQAFSFYFEVWVVSSSPGSKGLGCYKFLLLCLTVHMGLGFDKRTAPIL